MIKTLRYGMVGGDLKAFIGEVHRKAINFDTRAKLVAGCFSIDPILGKECAEAYGVDMSRNYLDYKEDVTKEKALNELTKRVHNGAIYLMHPKNKGNYLALDTFIKNMKKQGYTFDLVKNIK